MATIEEILEANERPLEEVQANIKYKEILTPAILNFITYANNELLLAEDDPGFKGLIQHLKLVIGGGAAFNYYIKKSKQMNVLETHDFDLRLYLDIPPTRNPLFGKNVKNVENWMTDIAREIGKSFAGFLNKYIKKSDIVVELDNRHITTSKFRMVDHGFLTTIEYDMSLPGSEKYTDSMIDIVPHIPAISVHYGKMEIDKEKNFKQYEEENFSGIKSRQGFFKASLMFTQDSYGVYYTSLGFLIWDTVSMLNMMIDSRYFGFRKRKNHPDFDPTLKFERYLRKYKALLIAISKPELHLRCEAMDKFVAKCNNLKQVCKVDNKKIYDKAELVYEGVQKGVFPNDVYWYKELMKLDFSTICNSVVEG